MSFPSASFFLPISQFFSRLSPPGRARLGLACLALGQALFLLLGDKPWNVEVPEGKDPRLGDHVTIYGWVGTLIGLGVTAGLFATARWWMAPFPMPVPLPATPQTPRWFWIFVAAAMVLTACFAVPRLDESLWDDEDYNVRYSILGRFQRSDDGEVKFRKLPWLDTFYDYREPNNHVLHSLLARTSLEIWSAVTRPSGLPFAEWPLRLPAFFFGLAAVGSAAWFAKEFFGPRAGVLAACLLAMHPWFIRYASEARGYSMALCLLPLAFVLWRRCLARGNWRWWIAYAVTQWAAIYSYPGVLVALALLNLLALPLLLWSAESARPFRVQSGRWFAANCFAALAVIQLMLPLYPQAKAYFAYETSRNITLGWPWVQSTLSFLALGVPWTGESPEYPSFLALAGAQPVWLGVFSGLLGALALLGFFRFLKKDGLSAAVALVIVLPPIITFGISVSRKHLIYSSYVIYALPGLVVFVAVALAGLALGVGRWPGGRIAAALLPGAFLAGYFLVTAPPRNWLASNPLQPTRDAVLLSRGSLDPWDPRAAHIFTASFCIPPYLYDGNLQRLSSTEEFIALMHRADREKKKLVLNIGMPWAARAFSPKMWELFSDPSLFQDRVHLRGFDSGLDRVVATYVPGSAARFDFSAYQGPGR